MKRNAQFLFRMFEGANPRSLAEKNRSSAKNVLAEIRMKWEKKGSGGASSACGKKYGD